MLDLRQIRDEPDLVRARLRVRGREEYTAAVDRLLELDGQRRSLISEVDGLRARRNEVSPQVGRLKQAGQHEQAEPLILEMRSLGERMSTQESRLAEIENLLRDLLLNIPNLPEEQVPAGGEEANEVVREWGEEREHDFAPQPHWELGEQLGILDLPRGTKIAGSGFPLYIGMGARLERALINLMLDMHVREHGYTEVSPPFVVR